MKKLDRILSHRAVQVIDTDFADGAAFFFKTDKSVLSVIVSWNNGWDHVSVSLPNRTPRYEEMKAIKRLCFEPHEWAFELHAPVSNHINIHPNCLHLWRPHNNTIPIPPSWMV